MEVPDFGVFGTHLSRLHLFDCPDLWIAIRYQPPTQRTLSIIVHNLFQCSTAQDAMTK